MTLGGSQLSIATLIDKADSDEKVMAMGWISESVLCHHAREAVGYLLVALLTALRIPYERTDSLQWMRAQLEQRGETLPSTPIILENLSDFTEEYRYDLLSATEPLDRQKLTEGVQMVREYVMKRLTELARPA